MGFFDWIAPKRDIAIESFPRKGNVLEVEEVSFYGLDLRKELHEHKALRGYLQNVLEGKSIVPPEMSSILQHEMCALGQWLEGEGKLHYGHLPEYKAACKAHREFHVCAAAVLTHHQNGNTLEAENMLQTKFRTASNKNQLELIKLFTVSAR